LNVQSFVLVIRCAKALCVFPRVFTTESLGLDVIDLDGRGYEAALRAVSAKGLGVYPSIA